MPVNLPEDCVRLLDFQRGAIARWQAPEVGLSPPIIDAMLRRGRWQPLYRGVYAAYTGDPPRDCLEWGAVLRAGAGAVLSHYTSARLDGLTEQPAQAIHVTVGHDRHVRMAVGERHEAAPPIVFHRTDRIEIIRHPARTPPRTRIEETVLDLTQIAASFDRALFWLSAACGRRLVTAEMLHGAAARRGRLRWRDEILGALEIIPDGVHSNLEFRYVRDVERAHGLPLATRQARMTIGRPSQYADNLYEAFGVAVELDGQAAHLVEDRWRDIHRDNFSARSGIITLRYSWADVTRRPCAVAADIIAVLRQRGWTGAPSCCGPHCMALRK